MDDTTRKDKAMTQATITGVAPESFTDLLHVTTSKLVEKNARHNEYTIELDYRPAQVVVHPLSKELHPLNPLATISTFDGAVRPTRNTDQYGIKIHANIEVGEQQILDELQRLSTKKIAIELVAALKERIA
jgi:hypothetical protein